jgi:hypothetical protein
LAVDESQVLAWNDAMSDLQPCALRARQLLILANACEGEDERTAYYALAEACLEELDAAESMAALQDA